MQCVLIIQAVKLRGAVKYSSFWVLEKIEFFSPDISPEHGVAGFPGDPILSTQRIPRGRDRIFSTQRIPRWGDHRGAMRQKMAIFKGGNSVWRVQMFFKRFLMERCWWLYEIFGGRPCRKWLFSKGKIGQRLRIFGFFNGAMLMITWNLWKFFVHVFLTSLIAQHPFCKIIFLKLFSFGIEGLT